MERDDPDSRKSRISTIDAIGQKAAVTSGFFGCRSLSLMRQLRTFIPMALGAMATRPRSFWKGA